MARMFKNQIKKSSETTLKQFNQNDSTFLSTKCPLCSKPLDRNEIEKVQKKLESEISEKVEKLENENKEKIQSIEIKNQNQIDEIKHHYDEQLEKFKKIYTESNDETIKLLEEKHENDIKLRTKELDKDIKKLENTLESEKQKNREAQKDIENKIKKETQREIDNLKKQIKNYEESEEQIREQISLEEQNKHNEEKKKSKNTILEQGILISRLREQLEDVQNKLKEKQSELQGEVGEINLYVHLTERFAEDHFKRQKRGASTGDIIQQIRYNGELLDTPIVYDNKSGNTVTKKDIEKAKKYQQTHNTRYVLIVSSNLPKNSVSNGYFASKDGVFLVHPSIVSEIANNIRESIILVSKNSHTKEQELSIQEKLFAFLTSDKFSLIMERQMETIQNMEKLQTKEEKDHKTMWNSKKEFTSQLVNTHIDLLSNIDSILQKNLENE